MVARMLQVQTNSLVAGKLVLHSVSGALLTCCWAGSAWKAPVLCDRPPTGDSATLTVVPLAMVDSVPLGDVMACSRAACHRIAMAVPPAGVGLAQLHHECGQLVLNMKPSNTL
jgi:hypothetical protein